MFKQMEFSNASAPIMNIVNSIETVKFGGLDLQPSYQRGYVWKDDFKDKLIYSIIKQYPTGNISIRVLQEKNDKSATREVVDGQQRLTTIWNFVSDKYVVKSEWSRKIIEEIQGYFLNANIPDKALDKLVKKLGNKGKISIKFSDLPFVIKNNINSYNLAVTSISNASEEQIREYFRFLQNQERLRAGEIINSMPATNLEKLLDEISNKTLFLDKIGFSDDRSEFDKIFYSIIGLFDSKLSFGSADKTIQNYAAKALYPVSGLPRTKEMIRQINAIINADNVGTLATRKRYLKYFLLLAGLGYVDFTIQTEEKLKNLKQIDDALSVFFSAKANVVQERFKGCPKEVISELRLVALLTKGGHSLARVENRMRILAHYVNDLNGNMTPSEVKLIEE